MVVSLLVSSRAAAQTQSLHGTVEDEQTSTPVPGVLITVRDDAGRVIARVLTDSVGRFYARPDTGRYVLTAEHIGFSPREVPVRLPLDGGVMLRLSPAPVALREVVAEVRQRCRGTNEKETARVWYFARTALGATAAENRHRFRIRQHTRDFDLAGKRASNERTEFTTSSGRHAFRAVTADTVLRRGFVQDSRDGRIFYGPDAELLLSDAFVNEHCFQVTRRANRRGLIGLAFWPNHRRSEPDIRGTLWLAEETGALQFVEYVFTNLPDNVRERDAGGRVEFDQLADGSWIVRRWTIRAPRYSQIGSGGRMRPSLVGSVEAGGEVLGIDEPATRTGGNSRIAGAVFDSLAMRPLGGAHVYLSGTAFATVADEHGRFVIDSLPAGEYFIDFHHTRLDSLPAMLRSEPVPVADGSVTTVALAFPGAQAIVERHCTSEELAEAAAGLGTHADRLGLLTGRIRSRGAVHSDLRVEIAWRATEAMRVSTNPRTGAWAEPDSNGSFALCGVPFDVDLTVKVMEGQRVLASALIRASGRRVLHREFVIE